MAENPTGAKVPQDPTPPLDHPAGAPVAEPAPPMDGKKPVAKGADEVEKFLVITDTGGGD